MRVKALGRLKAENHDQKTGIDIVRRAVSTPARQIAVNAGEDASIVVGKISENDTYAFDATRRLQWQAVLQGLCDAVTKRGVVFGRARLEFCFHSSYGAFLRGR